MKNKRDILSSVIAIALSILLIAASILYLTTGKMIPGLIPLITTILMIPMISIWGKRKGSGKLYAILFATAAVLNLTAAIMQIAKALS